MRIIAAGVILVASLGFSLGQLAAPASGAQDAWLSCAPLTSELGHSQKSSSGHASTVDYVGYCYSYYLTCTIVNNGNVLTCRGGGWASSYRLITFASGTTSVFSTHNTYRDWYNGYVGTDDY